MTAIQPFRSHDFVYDPLFIVSGEKDLYKAAVIAKLKTAKFQLCPIFINMFSDSPNHPSKRLVVRRTRHTPTFADIDRKETDRIRLETLQHQKQPEAGGYLTAEMLARDRCKYFTYNVVNLPDENMPYMHIPTFKLRNVRDYQLEKEPKTRNKKVQTLYRESEAQTTPWEPPYEVVDGGDPEILKLDFLKWGAGLPAGMHEVLLIERARKKRAWENAMPKIVDEADLQKRKDIIDAMERDEWAFREQEIQDIQDLRLELLEQMLSELHERSKNRTEERMNMIIKAKEAVKEEQLAKLRRQTTRELRKLDMQHKGINMKYHTMNIVDEHIQHSSELYGPLMRHGEHPKRWHQVIDEHIDNYRAHFIGVEHLSTLPRWLNQATRLQKEIKLPGTRLCVRETKWTTPILKELHEELKNLGKAVPKKPCSLRIKIDREEFESITPEVEAIADDEEENYQATVFIQSVIRGRASQMLIYEGRDRCRELIQELRHAHSLKSDQRAKRIQRRRYIMQQHKDENIYLNKKHLLLQNLHKLQGRLVGSLLDFLNKELRRLLDERKAHAMCFLNERERQNAEAAEAGRRQKEIRRRREHDEMFRQVVKVHQDTVDLYLQDIITEGMDFASSEEAQEYVKRLSDKIDEATNDIAEPIKPVDKQEELIADLVHHFMLPEVEKRIVRERIQQQQRQNMRMVHDTIYRRIEKLPRASVTVAESQEYVEGEEMKSMTHASLATSGTEASEWSKISYVQPKPASKLIELPRLRLSDFDKSDQVSLLYGFMPKTAEDETALLAHEKFDDTERVQPADLHLDDDDDGMDLNLMHEIEWPMASEMKGRNETERGEEAVAKPSDEE